jgi:hypothetical protein
MEFVLILHFFLDTIVSYNREPINPINDGTTEFGKISTPLKTPS